MTTTRRLRDDCGGARFLDLSGLLLVFPFALVTSVLSSAPADLASSWRWLAANLGAFAATGMVVVLARSMRQAWHGTVVPMTIVIVTGAVVGAVKGVTTSWFATLLDLVDDPWRDILGRGVNTTVLGALTIPALAALLAAQDRWKAERDLLMVELVRRSLDRRDPVRGSHRDELQHIVERTNSAMNALNPTEVAAELRHIVDQEIRPLSTRILESAQPPPLSQGWDLLRVAVRSEPWSVGIVTLLFTTTTWLLLVRYVDPGEALVRSLLAASVTASSVWIGSRLRIRCPRASEIVLLAVLLNVSWTQWVLGDPLYSRVEGLAHPGVLVTTAIWLGQLIVATAMITAARRQRDHIRAQLLDLLGPGGVRDAVGHGMRALEGREFALFLHGHLQNRLVAAAQRLETATDPDTRHQALDHVRELLEEATASAMAPTPLSTRLAEVVDRWRGLADIEVMVDPALAPLAGDVTERVTNVVVEAITNAMRHGAAQRISVRITFDDHGQLLVTVADDGFGPRRGRPGTGSHYLDIVTLGKWALTPNPDGGALLTARLDHANT